MREPDGEISTIQLFNIQPFNIFRPFGIFGPFRHLNLMIKPNIVIIQLKFGAEHLDELSHFVTLILIKLWLFFLIRCCAPLVKSVIYDIDIMHSYVL